MNLSGRRPQLIATIVMCVVVLALGIGVVAQQLSATRLSGDIAEQKRLIAESKKDLKSRTASRDEYSDLSLTLGGRMSTCTWSDQMPYMVSQVTGIVEANRVRVESLQPEPMTSSGSVQRFPMRLGLQADLRHVTDILQDLKTAVPLIDIERLDIRNSQTGNGKLQINMTVASFVVLDKNSPVTRRRAVIPARKAEKPKEETGTENPAEKPEAGSPAQKPQVKQPAKSVSGPPPVVKPVDRPRERPTASERKSDDRPEVRRTEKPVNGKTKPGAVETSTTGKSADTPVRLDAEEMGIRRTPQPEGGAK